MRRATSSTRTTRRRSRWSARGGCGSSTPPRARFRGGDNPFKPDHTNPKHSFEIHPIVTVGQVDVHKSFVPIKDAAAHPPANFVAYAAGVAFPYFDGLSVTIQASQSAVVIRSQQLKYNYVEFFIELTHKPKKVTDGYIALAEVLDKDGEQQSPERRMIFVEGTEGAKAMSQAASGERFHVLGIPRLNLNAISHLVGNNGTKQFEAKLPYEMIIVGIYPD